MSEVLVATISYDTDAKEGDEFSVGISELGCRMLATLTDFELRVVAAELGLRVRHAIEMPPSPKSTPPQSSDSPPSSPSSDAGS